MRPWHEIAGAGKSLWATRGEHWGGSAGKAGGRCKAAYAIPVHYYICSCVHRARGLGRKATSQGIKKREVLEGKRREGAAADRDQRVKHRLRGMNGIGQEERNGSKEHQQGKGSKDTPGVCWSQGRIRNNSE